MKSFQSSETTAAASTRGSSGYRQFVVKRKTARTCRFWKLKTFHWKLAARYNFRVRAYLKLLRLPYQFQLGPIFLWGAVLTHLTALVAPVNWPRVLAIFLLLHIFCFGGLTALNSFYDRDDGPIGGLWNAPKLPSHLFSFASSMQLFGWFAMLFFSARIALIYAAIALLALGYSHPKTRWKGHPLQSVLVVALGQGALDFCAGIFATHEDFGASQLSLPLICGLVGATLSTVAFYPLTQLYQSEDDARRGDFTTAQWLQNRGGRRTLFVFCGALFTAAFACHAASLLQIGAVFAARVLAAGAASLLLYLLFWSREIFDARRDFLRVHWLLRVSALAFTALLALLIFR